MTLSVVAAAATVESTRIPSSSLLAPLRASSVTSLVVAIAPVWTLTVVTFQALVPPPVSRVASLSKGGPSPAPAALVMSRLTAGVAW